MKKQTSEVKKLVKVILLASGKAKDLELDSLNLGPVLFRIEFFELSVAEVRIAEVCWIWAGGNEPGACLLISSR